VNSRRRTLLNIARVLISAGLLAWVISRSGLEALLAAARDANLALLAGAYALAIAGMFMRTYRWLILLKAARATVSAWRALYLYFVGGFFNVFLPTGLGGDVLRVLEIGPGASSEQAAATVLVDRLTGFVVLFVMALAALPFSASLLPPGTAILIGLLSGAVCLGALLLFEGRLLRRLTAWLPAPLSLASEGWLGRTYAVITGGTGTGGAGTRPAATSRAIRGALGVSTVYNLSVIWASVLVARAFGLQVSAWHFLSFTPIAVVALLVPISIGGLGVREGIYVTLFGQVGLSAAQATVLSLGVYSLDVFTGLLGGVIYLLAGVLGLRSAKESRAS